MAPLPPFLPGVSLYVPVPSSLYLLPGTLAAFSCLCLLRCWTYIMVYIPSDGEGLWGSIRIWLQLTKEEVLANV